MISGIYSITNSVNGKTYYGSSKNIRVRWREHKKRLDSNKHENAHLQKAWNRYGKDSFIFTILEEFPISELQRVEQQYLDWIKLIPSWFYNISLDACSPTRGRKLSKEHVAKIVAANTGRKASDETRALLRQTHLGHIASNETKQKMSQKHSGSNNYWFGRFAEASPHFGKKRSEETKLKMRLNHKRSNLGKQLPESTKAKLRLRKRGSNNAAYKSCVHTFRNRLTSEMFTGTRYDFYTKYNLCQANVSAMLGGRVKTVKNWMVCNNETN
jgi:group I intron endonuclease